MNTSDCLLLAAFEPELAGLYKYPPKGWRVFLTGIGGVTAAATTSSFLNELRPARVLFVGTCGAYRNDLETGDCIFASKVIATSVSEIRQRAYRPSQEVTQWLATWDLPLPAHVVAVTPAITTITEDAAKLGQIADVEHLELAGIFAACYLAKVPVSAALAVANHVGPEAYTEWCANHERVSVKLVETLNYLDVFNRS